MVAVIAEHEGVVDGVEDALWRAPSISLASAFCAAAFRAFAASPVALRIGGEAKSLELTDMLTFDHHVAGSRDFGFEHCILSQATHQHAGAAIHETLGEAFVKRVGQTVLYLTRDALPMLWILEPARSIGDEGPCPHLGEPRGERMDVPVDAIDPGNLLCEPIVWDMAAAHDEAIDGEGELGMGGRRGLAIIWNLAHVPESHDIGLVFALRRTISSRAATSSTI